MMTPELNELVEMLGPDKVKGLLERFAAELDAFDRQRADMSGAPARAHRLVSQAGMLGFHALSQAARDFETLHGSSPQPQALYATLVDEASRVSGIIAGLLSPGIRAQRN